MAAAGGARNGHPPDRRDMWVSWRAGATVGAQDVQVERAVGSVGFITMQSWPPRGATAEVEGAGQSLEEAERDRSQQMQPGSVQAKLYTGCVCPCVQLQRLCCKSVRPKAFHLHQLPQLARSGRAELTCEEYRTRRIMTGEKANARVLLKAYPARRAGGGKEADAMAANEFRTLAQLQPPQVPELNPFITKLLGGFQATDGLTAGEQWLVFRFDGTTSAADYAAVRAHTHAPPLHPHTTLTLTVGTPVHLRKPVDVIHAVVVLQEASVATSERRAVGNADFLDRYELIKS